MTRLSVILASGMIAVAACATAPAAMAEFSCRPFVGRNNMIDACNAINAAHKAIIAAETANNRQLGGHANQADILLGQAYQELVAAADVSNRR